MDIATIIVFFFVLPLLGFGAATYMHVHSARGGALSHWETLPFSAFEVLLGLGSIGIGIGFLQAF